MMSKAIVIKQDKELSKYQSTTKPIVAFLFKDGAKKTYKIGTSIRGLAHRGTRPIGIEWYGDSIDYIPSESDIEWINSELRYVFECSHKFDNAVKSY